MSLSGYFPEKYSGIPVQVKMLDKILDEHRIFKKSKIGGKV
jgi:hypothetical protein